MSDRIECCQRCVAWIDHRQPDDEPGEPDGYCANPDAPGYSPTYGGQWRHHGDVCPAWAAKTDPEPSQRWAKEHEIEAAGAARRG